MKITLSAVAWFAQNQDEELSCSDMAVKFGADENAVRQAMQRLMREGWVLRIRKDDPTARLGLRYFYAAGPKLTNQHGDAGK